MPRSSSHSPALRGLATRVASMTLGATMASGMIFMMQLPLLHQASTSTSLLSGLKIPAHSAIAWPSVGSAAVVIPALGFEETHHDQVVPMASLTKLMTAYVTLKKLPLAPGETGPCITINAGDVANYDVVVQEGQSNAAVALGETLCENQLLAGLMVHSAGNYATLLANLAWGNTTTFVARMNEEARVLGLSDTHYADVAGIDSASVSTALDVAKLSALLMESPVIRTIADQATVTLPVAGTLGSYTPFVGSNNVVGVKSGRTEAAGGCDAMAMTFTFAGRTHIAYAVVMGARGGDLLGPAGDEALALERSILASRTSLWIPAGTVVGTIGWGGDRVNVVVKKHLRLDWFAALQSANVTMHVDTESQPLTPGEVVGTLQVQEGSVYDVPLTVEHALSPLTLAQRLR